ncbi:unnamed protein product [Ranitomeya imitator]|uniref:Uncharacterized protein n=1 Tax=Ranitomeya imitator TaxID=111125 RepID=A0ABN9M1E1_9NEOB|nr:unnamed protein product [Ranitomeya imitator]
MAYIELVDRAESKQNLQQNSIRDDCFPFVFIPENNTCHESKKRFLFKSVYWKLESKIKELQHMQHSLQKL